MVADRLGAHHAHPSQAGTTFPIIDFTHNVTTEGCNRVPLLSLISVFPKGARWFLGDQYVAVSNGQRNRAGQFQVAAVLGLKALRQPSRQSTSTVVLSKLHKKKKKIRVTRRLQMAVGGTKWHRWAVTGNCGCLWNTSGD